MDQVTKMPKMSKHEREYRAVHDLSDDDEIDEDDLVAWSPEVERMHYDDDTPFGEY